MFHILTIGFLDESAIPRARIVPTMPLPDGLIDRLAPYRDADGVIRFEGQEVVVGDGFIRCPWYRPVRNRIAVALALTALRDYGCVVADVEHGRLISEAELDRP